MHRTALAAATFLFSVPLAGCMSAGGHDVRYDQAYPAGPVVRATDLLPFGAPARKREAERKSVARDMPFAVVAPSGRRAH